MSEKVENINPAIIKKTQDTLGRLIQAPSLTDKLLNRPPVQFIQDIVKSVIKNTGLMKGLYSSEELEGAYIKASKDNKLIFLKKLITFVSLVIGDQLSVKESKIAAGAEAEKTNELLQCLAKAINIKPDNEEYVKKTLKKMKTQSDEPKEEPKEGRGSKEEKREKDRDKGRDDRSKEKDRDRDRSRDDRSKDKDRDPDRSRDERSKDKDRDRDRDDKKSRDREGKERDKDKDDRRERDRNQDDKQSKEPESKDGDERREKRSKDRASERDSSRNSRDKKENDGNEERSRRHSSSRGRRTEDNDENDSTRQHKESSSKSSSKNNESRRIKDDEHNGDERSSANKRSTRGVQPTEERNGDADVNDDEKDSNSQTRLRRPTSAKGGRKVATEEMAQQATQGQNEDYRNVPRPTTARPGAPRKRLTNETEETPAHTKAAQSSVIVDKDSESDDDFVVKEVKPQDDQKLAINGYGAGDANEDDNDDFDKNGNQSQHGALVKKILESKEQLENGSQLNNKKTESQKPTMQMDAQRKKERERIQKEIDKLKESIQTLTKSSIPLGRTLDFLQEDIDMMQKELIKWNEEYDLHSKALKRQQQESNLALEPYKAALNDVTNNINDQLEKIASVKRKILLNEDKISKLIFNIGKRN